LTGARVAQRARHALAKITGLEPEVVTCVERSEDDTWNVTVELLELRRIPNTQDVIGSYESKLDATGALRSYRRVRRYARCDPQRVQETGADDEQRVGDRDVDANDDDNRDPAVPSG
jgi:hypothetical protein